MDDDFDEKGHPKRFQPHLFTLYEGAPWRFIDNLRPEWSYHICMCDRFFWQDDFFFKNPHICKVCEKVNIQDFCFCKGCDKFYIRNFFHPAHCHYHDMLCWDCCQDAPVEPCCDKNAWRNKNLFSDIRPPKGRYEPVEIKSLDELYSESVAEFTL